MFLLVPAHPGCPGQNPQSHKTVVVVVVVLAVVFEFAIAYFSQTYYALYIYANFTVIVIDCSIDASDNSDTLGRLVNDDHISPNAAMKLVSLNNSGTEEPHLCLFALRTIHLNVCSNH